MATERTDQITTFGGHSPEGIRTVVMPLVARVFEYLNPPESPENPLLRWETEARDKTQVTADMFVRYPNLDIVYFHLVKKDTVIPVLRNDDFAITTNIAKSDHFSSIFVGMPFTIGNWFTSVCLALDEGMEPSAIKFAAEVADLDCKELFNQLVKGKRRAPNYTGDIYKSFHKRIAELRFRAY